MQEKLEFPMNLDSNRGHPPDEAIELTFANYFPISKFLQEKSNIVPVSKEPSEIVK